MKLPYVIIAILATILLVLVLDECQHNTIISTTNMSDRKEKINNKQEEVKKEEKAVSELKEKKARIKYRVVFDTIPVYDTLWVNLVKCDSIVKIDSAIIDKLENISTDKDTIIKGQEEIISDLDSHNQVLESNNKKLRRKLIFTKVVTGAILIISLIVAK